MKQIVTIVISFFMATLCCASYADAKKTAQVSFKDYIKQVAKQAEKKGVKEETINQYLLSITPPKAPKKSKQVKDLKHEAQDVLTFKQYMAQFITKDKIAQGRKLYKKHLPLLKKVQRTYHVQPEFIVAIWGIESDFGKFTGNFPLVRSLALVSYAKPDSAYLKTQLIDALIMLDRPVVIPQQLKSAFDGGMGQTQFEPSSYLQYGVDFDHTGFSDIWTSLPDVFASISYFLQQNGWVGQQPWGMPVTLPENFDKNNEGLKVKKFNRDWNSLGVRQLNGKKLPALPGKTSILTLPWKGSPTFLVFQNFRTLLDWNNTNLEALAIGYLADAIVNQEPSPTQSRKREIQSGVKSRH